MSTVARLEETTRYKITESKDLLHENTEIMRANAELVG